MQQYLLNLRGPPLHLRSILLTAALALPLAAHAADPSDIAFHRAAQLDRGINLSMWFAQSNDLSAEHIAKYTTPADFQLIHDLGFTWVRLGVNPTQLTGWDSAAAYARLDTAISQILAAHLSIALCVFPEDDYKRNLASDDGALRFLNLWRQLAHHYANTDPDHLFLEVINEPEVSDTFRWDGLQASAVSVIRHEAPNHTIIATASRYSGLSELLRLQPVRDANVIYNFHFYEPFPFTHQGATWGSFEWNFYKDIPYPATTEQINSALGKVPDDLDRYNLYLYAAAGWNQPAILGRLHFARAWADEHHVPLICDEFGAYRETAPADSRARYLHDVRSTFEQLHIGWAMWDYSGGFGIVTKSPDGHTIVDASTATALGLTPPK